MPSITQKSKISFLVQRAKSVTVVDTISATVILFIQKAGRRFFFAMTRFLLNYFSGVRCGVRLFKAFRARLTKVRLRRRLAYASRPLERV